MERFEKAIDGGRHVDERGKGPELYDPVEAPEDSRWAPANTATEKLLACIEACKDIARYRAMFPEGKAQDRRALGRLSVPVIGLADALLSLRQEVGREDRSGWPAQDQRNLVDWGKQVAKLADGPLRKFRHTRGAHYDAETIMDQTVPVPSFDLVLNVLRPSLALLVLYLNHEDVFHWSRRPAIDSNVVQLSQGGTLAPRFVIDSNGSPVALAGVTITPDPRLRALDHVMAAIDTYNDLANRSGNHARIDLA